MLNSAGWLRLKAWMGMDRAVAYTICARVSTILGNIGTVVLMVRALSPVEQGYYFTLLALVALQVIFELGFSFVILQMAAHERAHLGATPGAGFGGNLIAHARLASILQLALRWYCRAAVAVGAVLLPLGILFFSRNQRPGVQIHWLFPWLVAVTACVYLFPQIPLFAFLEGCGEVREVAGQRVCQAVAASVFAWASMLAGHGLFAPGLSMMAAGGMGTIFLWRRRGFLMRIVRHPAQPHAISWRQEIWPLQWKVAVTWLSAYFTVQCFTPLLFHYRSAVEAGRMGMSVSVVGYVSAFVLAWMTTKAPRFAQFVARREFGTLDDLFFRTRRQASCFLAVMVAGCMLGIVLLGDWFPALAARLVSPRVFVLLLLGTVGSTLVQSLAIYLRSFKREPLLWQSVGVAALTLLGARATVRTMGATGVALSYCLFAGLIGSFFATMIFRSWRRGLALDEACVIPFTGAAP
jgi:hypothetical protein